MSQANSEQDLIDLNQQLGEAEKTKNEAFLRSILSEALRFRRANGTIIDKAIFLDDFRSYALYKSSQVCVNEIA